MTRALKYVWFVLIMCITGWLPDFTIVLRFRGMLVRPCFKKCGRNFQIASRATILHSSAITVGDDVYIAHGCWVQGVGGLTLGSEVMLGPYTVIATNNHTRLNGSYRFGQGAPKPVTIGGGTWTGAHVVVTAGASIGEGSLCAAGAVITRDIPSNSLAVGAPARIVRNLEEFTITSDNS